MNILVNKVKEERAKDILALVLGTRVPKNDGEADRRDKFTAFLAEGNVDPKKPEAVQFVYEKLGGLVRTESEQKEADKRKQEMQLKAKKRMIE